MRGFGPAVLLASMLLEQNVKSAIPIIGVWKTSAQWNRIFEINGEYHESLAAISVADVSLSDTKDDSDE